jgi:uncharacterized membrane protein YgcG
MISLILIFGVFAALIVLFLIIKNAKSRNNYSNSTPLDSGFQSNAGETSSNNFDGFGGGEFGGGGAEGSWGDTGSSDSGGDGGGGDGGGGD